MSMDWYRVEYDRAPQGHALATDWNDSVFVAWEELDGWWVKRIDGTGFETKPMRADNFNEVRQGVEYVQRQPNPDIPNGTGGYIRVGVGALIGTVLGMGLGGLPGIIKKNEALATVGAQIGGVVGATAGAVVAHSIQSSDRQPSTAELKSKLLK